jgi:hypothetical protein
MLPLTALLALLGCGGGSGGGGAAQGAGATLRPSLQGTLASGAQVGSLDLTLTLPAGVTVKADANGQALDGVVAPAGSAAGALAAAAYTPADATHPARLRIMVIKAAGFGTGEFASIKCDLAGVPAPAAGAIGLSGLAVTDLDSVPIGGLTAGVAVGAP